ncbi:hypothetical protein PHYSODRAFT_288877 [Phytophthora sojae]|uniref:RxLR effector protein n=2 Tax=Phytophthora sojae TaxID=67593 RepID=G5A9Q3_PHYSP|nr:hypothetical protein PHYSODRAFT_288877 [Phytophthora sojae]AEK81193.1 Avh335 [Phytophthora sojae]EGZ07333.1 hypothetical protein PHYSODRAFT_288877 [Phytophthora sojae]|eukprot:XP_009536899.1 hypothetical protein PHYSODRAFT_288877 [Phytophthora sojae]
MRLRHSTLVTVLLVCVALVVDAKESSDAKMPTLDSASLSRIATDNLADRSLRAGDKVEKNDDGNANREAAATEEMGGLPGLPQVKGLGATVTSKAKMPEQFKLWLQYSYSMDETFKILKLDDEASKLLANPHLKTWMSYGRVVGEENKLTESPVITDLLKRFGAAKLSETIEAAKKSVWTKTIAEELQDLLLSH